MIPQHKTFTIKLAKLVCVLLQQTIELNAVQK
jgi:hypothetical protein